MWKEWPPRDSREESSGRKATSVSGWGRAPADLALPPANHMARHREVSRHLYEKVKDGMRSQTLWTYLVSSAKRKVLS